MTLPMSHAHYNYCAYYTCARMLQRAINHDGWEREQFTLKNSHYTGDVCRQQSVQPIHQSIEIAPCLLLFTCDERAGYNIR